MRKIGERVSPREIKFSDSGDLIVCEKRRGVVLAFEGHLPSPHQFQYLALGLVIRALG
jgi:hypothetical protein